MGSEYEKWRESRRQQAAQQAATAKKASLEKSKSGNRIPVGGSAAIPVIGVVIRSIQSFTAIATLISDCQWPNIRCSLYEVEGIRIAIWSDVKKWMNQGRCLSYRLGGGHHKWPCSLLYRYHCHLWNHQRLSSWPVIDRAIHHQHSTTTNTL